MHKYTARIHWQRKEARFSDLKYSRGHEWSFDGGARIPASSSPTVVPLPYSVAAAVDPEEALVASASSCHMLGFLYFAARKGFVVDSYMDEAEGELTQGPAGRAFISLITLRPRIEFSGDRVPSAADLESLHHSAHSECYIANSLKCDVVVEARSAV